MEKVHNDDQSLGTPIISHMPHLVQVNLKVLKTKRLIDELEQAPLPGGRYRHLLRVVSMRAEFKGLTWAELFNVGELVATFGIPSNEGLHPSWDC